MCTNALYNEPGCAPLRLIRARAQIALGRDLDAMSDLRDVVRLDPLCNAAFRLLGELSARRDEYDSAAIFFREALRLDPNDREASRWLLVIDRAARLPDPQLGGVRFSQTLDAPAPLVLGPISDAEDDHPTLPFARGSDRHGEGWPAVRLRQAPRPVPRQGAVQTTISGPPPTIPPQARPPRLANGSRGNARIPELPGFSEYLVSSGLLTRERLRAAQAYQRSMRVELSTAIVTLGLATRQRIEWAAVAHQSQLAHGPAPK